MRVIEAASVAVCAFDSVPFDDQVIAKLLSLVKDESAPTSTRESAASAIAHFGEPAIQQVLSERAVMPLIKMLAGNTYTVRAFRTIVDGVCRYGSPDQSTIRVLKRLFESAGSLTLFDGRVSVPKSDTRAIVQQAVDEGIQTFGGAAVSALMAEEGPTAERWLAMLGPAGANALLEMFISARDAGSWAGCSGLELCSYPPGVAAVAGRLKEGFASSDWWMRGKAHDLQCLTFLQNTLRAEATDLTLDSLRLVLTLQITPQTTNAIIDTSVSRLIGSVHKLARRELTRRETDNLRS